MRREQLKLYLFALIAEGDFQNLKTPAAVMKKAASIFMLDLPSVVGEITAMLAVRDGRPLTAAGINKLNEILQDVGTRGIKNVWADIKAQYKRGMDANSARRGG